MDARRSPTVPRTPGWCQRLPVNALAAAGVVVVPVAAQAMELGGLADLEETIAAVREGARTTTSL